MAFADKLKELLNQRNMKAIDLSKLLLVIAINFN